MKAKILVVEDHSMMQVFIQTYFSEKYEIILKKNPIEALCWLEEGERPDLILTDNNMPGMSGAEFVETLKSSVLYKDIPCIVLSGMNKSEDRIRLLKLGAQDYFVKPFNPEELEVKIDQYVSV